MKHLVEVRTEAGGTLLVEVDDDGATAPIPATTAPVPAATEPVRRGLQPSQVAATTQATFEDGLRAVLPTAGTLVNLLRDGADQPNTITLSFGLTMNAAAGVVLASAGVQANFSVTLTWMRSAAEAAHPTPGGQ